MLYILIGTLDLIVCMACTILAGYSWKEKDLGVATAQILLSIFFIIHAFCCVYAYLGA